MAIYLFIFLSFSTSKQNKTRLNYNCSWINNGTKHKWIITVPIKISILITDVDVNVVSLEWLYGTFGDNQDFLNFNMIVQV